VVATPLGNLQDITLRALEVLRAVEVVFAEDTRRTQRLFDAYGIRARLFALHEHNEQASAGGLIGQLEQGRPVALVSDAGTPAVSDPGARAVARVRQAGFPVVSVPGACAAVAALSVAGMHDSGFHFAGFLPPKSAARRTALEALLAIKVPLVFYEAPHRVCDCVADLVQVLGAGRHIVFARELTKLHEEVAAMPLGEGAAWLAADPNRQRGEYVLVVSGAEAEEGLNREHERVLSLLLAELPLKRAVALAVSITGAARNLLYARALELKND